MGKILRDEVSPEGIDALRRKGSFGPLLKLFPAEATNWAEMAGVKPEDCVAFRLDRTDGLRAEVVLAGLSSTNTQLSGAAPCYRIVRCNNVVSVGPRTASNPSSLP